MLAKSKETIWAHFVKNFVNKNFQKSPNLVTLGHLLCFSEA